MADFNALEPVLPSTSDLAGLDADAALARIAQAFADAGSPLPASPTAPADGPDHTLVVWTEDYYNRTKVFAVPEGAFSDELMAAFATVDGAAYAYDEIMEGGEASAAYLRVDVATDQADWEDMIEEFEDVDPDLAESIPEDERNCLVPYLIATFDGGGAAPVFVDGGFDKRFTARSLSRRCM